MNDLQVFQNPVFGVVRTVKRGNDVLFAGEDIAVALGYAKPKNAIDTYVDEKDKCLIQRSESATFEFINESGVFALVENSKSLDAEDFKSWITDEVIPTVRKGEGWFINE